MSRFLLALAAGLLAVLSGCGDDENAATTAPPDVRASEFPVPAPDPSTAGPGPSVRSSDAVPTAEPLDSVLADVRIAAPRLEGFFRGQEYPRELADVVAALAEAGVALSPGNRLGAYRYDPDAVEFVLCVENSSGAFATYDTAPMATGEKGEDGGCPGL